MTTSNVIRLRTDIGDDKSIKVKLEQDFDLIKVLSLNISQEDVYRRFCSDYGVLVGRVTSNNGGIGIPNAKVSIFIPLSEDDEDNTIISNLYPYKTVNDVNSDGVRYNLLPKSDLNDECLTVNGTYPSKEDLLNNPVLLEIHNKYYKYTTTTNESGDYMLFGLPLGVQMAHMDVDLSDIGIYSQYPYDFVRNGTPLDLFASSRKFRKSNDLNSLPQIKIENKTINIIPFWGDTEECEIGITRLDFNIRYNIEPHAIFLGSVLTDDGKNSIGRGCKPRRKNGSFCEMETNSGFIRMLREQLDGNISEFNPYGIDLIDDNGVFAYQVPMNLNYVVTDEFGRLVPTNDTRRGIATSSNVRFKFDILQSGNEKKKRFRGSYLVPNHPIKNVTNIDLQFNNTLNKDKSLFTMYWNNIYTVSNYIPKYHRRLNITRNHTGIKDVDSCSDRNIFPFNKVDSRLNAIYVILAAFVTVFSFLVSGINGLIFALNGLLRFIGAEISCISLSCSDGKKYAPGCQCNSKGFIKLQKNEGSVVCSGLEAYNDCQRVQIANALGVIKFDFYNDWINGVLYFPLMKSNKNGDRFCNYDASDNNLRIPLYYNENCMTTRKSSPLESTEYTIRQPKTGFVTQNDDEFIYSPKVGNIMGFATDIITLGSIFDADTLNANRLGFIGNIPPTTYRIPETGTELSEDNVNYVLGLNPLLVDLSISSVNVNTDNCKNINRICQLGVDEDVEHNSSSEVKLLGLDNIFDDETRKFLMASNLLQSPINLNDNFNTKTYLDFTGETDLGIGQPISTNIPKIIKYNKLRSFYFYFGLNISKTAVDVFNKRFFGLCNKDIDNSININGDITNVSEIGGSNGSITNINIIGVVSNNFSYTWLNSLGVIISDMKDLLNQSIGKYTIIILDNNTNMEYSRDFFISGLADIDFNLAVSGFNVDTFNINVNNIIGGTAPFKVELMANGIDIKTFMGVDRLGVTFDNLDDYIIFTDTPYDIKITDSTGYIKFFDKQIIFERILPIASEVVNIINPTSEIDENGGVVFNNDGSVRINISGGKPNYTIKVVNDEETYSSILVIEDVDGSFYHESLDISKGEYTYTIEDSIGNKHIDNFIL